MKLVTFQAGDSNAHIGAVRDDGAIVDFTASGDAVFRDMLSLIDGGATAMERARRLLSTPPRLAQSDEVHLLAPLPEPRQMRDFMCFEKHVRQARANRHLVGAPSGITDPAKIEVPPVWYDYPIYYKCNRFSVIGPETDILWPSYAEILDYELEFGIVTGRRGKNILREQARDYIFGYCIFNDISARDFQMQEMKGQLGPAKGKDFDTGNILGPWLVTADEIPDPYALTMIARVNGTEWSRGHSGDMYHRFEDILACVSCDETIMAGEFFGSGTVGSGCGLELGRFLSPGDVIELEVQGLGVLHNRVVRT